MTRTVFVTTFVISLVTGGLGVYLGARFVLGSEDRVNALVTGSLGALVLVGGGALFGRVPVVGQLPLVFVYVATIRRRYSADWIDAAKVSGIVWLTVGVVLALLAAVGVATLEVVGGPVRPAPSGVASIVRLGVDVPRGRPHRNGIHNSTLPIATVE